MVEDVGQPRPSATKRLLMPCCVFLDHPEHFVCTRADCRVPLLDHHFVLQGLPYCELHSVPTPPSKANNRITCGVAGLGAGGGSGRQMRGANDNGNAGGRGAPTTKAKKRMTFITKR